MGWFAPALGALELNFTTLPEQLVNGLMLGAIYALIALGYTMVYGILRLINFAHGEVFMLGAYTALFVGWAAIGNPVDRPDNLLLQPGTTTLISVGFFIAALALFTADFLRGKRGFGKSAFTYGGAVFAIFGTIGLLLAFLVPQATNLVIMLFASMIACMIVGVTIEFFAYRPMRSQPRISALITAIGVSLLLQYGGQIVLPTSPPPSINEQINPFRGSTRVVLKSASEETSVRFQEVSGRYEIVRDNFENIRDAAGAQGRSEFDLTPEEALVREEFNVLEREMIDVQREFDEEQITISVQNGQLIMFGTTIVLMIILTYVIMKTPVGRAMRAVSHDYRSASLMGINVNRIIMATFMIGSALAGAGAMMNATFLSTPLTTFYGFQPGVKAFVAAVLGGIGNIPGAVLGGFLMGMAETMVIWTGNSGYKDAIAFVILILVLMFKPGGLLGSSKVEKV